MTNLIIIIVLIIVVFIVLFINRKDIFNFSKSKLNQNPPKTTYDITLPGEWGKVSLKNYLKFYKIQSPSKIDIIKYIGNVSDEIINLFPDKIDEMYHILYFAEKTKPQAEKIGKNDSFYWFFWDYSIINTEFHSYTLRNLKSEYFGEENDIELYRNKLESGKLEYLVYVIASLLKGRDILNEKSDIYNKENFEKRINLAYEMPIDKALYVFKYFMGYDFWEEETNKTSEKRERKISQKVKDAVWRRAEGKCELCGSRTNLEFDHIVPFSKGGSNTYRNVQLLCEKCNREKYNKIG